MLRSLGLKGIILSFAVLLAVFPLVASAASLHFNHNVPFNGAMWCRVVDETLFAGIGISIGAAMEMVDVNWDAYRANEPFPNLGNAMGLVSLFGAMCLVLMLFWYHMGEAKFISEPVADVYGSHVPVEIHWMYRIAIGTAVFALASQLLFTARKTHRHIAGKSAIQRTGG